MLGTMMVLPLLVALFERSWSQVQTFGLIGGLLIFTAFSVSFALRDKAAHLSRSQTFVFAATTWLILPLLAMLPFLDLEHTSFIQAYFEAVSALTTTGTTLTDIDQMTRSMIMWRAVLSWFGGLLTLLMIVQILAPARVGGLSKRNLRILWHDVDSSRPGFSKTMRDVALPYGLLTLICTFLLIIFQIEPLTALTLAMSALSTGGFVPLANGMSGFENAAADWVMILFFIVGGTSILWHQMLLGRRMQLLRAHRECHYFIAAIVLISLGLFLTRYFDSVPDGLGLGEMVRRAMFEVTAQMTTGGMVYQSGRDFGVPFEFAILLALVGATTYSTGGGMKFFRIGVMLKYSFNEIQQLVYPNSVIRRRIGQADYGFAQMKSIWSFFFALLLIAISSLILLSIPEIPFQAALSSSIGAITNSGNLILKESMFGADGIYYSNLLTLSFAMIFGRLEIVVLLAALLRIRL